MIGEGYEVMFGSQFEIVPNAVPERTNIMVLDLLGLLSYTQRRYFGLGKRDVEIA